ncbi:MAG: hypothetical protein ACRDYA_00180 [Egibacteraceae bacterium]
MAKTLQLLVGLACLIGAVVGGGLKLFEIEFQPIASVPRQVLLDVREEWIGGWEQGREAARSFYGNALTVTIGDIDRSAVDFITTADSAKCETRDVRAGDSWSMAAEGRRYRVMLLSINGVEDAVQLELKCRIDNDNNMVSSDCSSDGATPASRRPGI